MRYLPLLVALFPIIASAILWKVRRKRVARYLKVVSLLAWIFFVSYFAWVVLDHYDVPEEQPLMLILGAGTIISLVVLWKVPQWQTRGLGTLEPSVRFDSENEARKTIAQIIAGVAILAGFYSAQNQLTVTQEGQITERYSRAIEQLGATDSLGQKRLELRLGGIYALERIARDSEKDHWPIMEILTAYVRENSPRRETSPTDKKEPSGPGKDIEAIMAVIGRRQARRDDFSRRLDLSGTDLRNINLRPLVINFNNPREVNLDFVLLSNADLDGADLSFAGLRAADFRGARLRNVKFQNSDLASANFSEADLAGADVLGAILSSSTRFYHADVSGVDFHTVKGISENELRKLLDSIAQPGSIEGRAPPDNSARPKP